MKDIEIQVGDYVVFYYPDHEENGFRVTSIDEDTVFVLTNDKHLAHGQIVSPGVFAVERFRISTVRKFPDAQQINHSNFYQEFLQQHIAQQGQIP